MIRSLILAAAAAVLLAGSAGADYVQIPGAGQAGAPYDGRWSVSISTTRGNCDGDGVITFHIANGRIVSDSVGADVSGSVGGAGDVRVIMVSAKGSASGSGRLGTQGGAGTWSAGAYMCGGTWQASRL